MTTAAEQNYNTDTECKHEEANEKRLTVCRCGATREKVQMGGPGRNPPNNFIFQCWSRPDSENADRKSGVVAK
jgi:hypothetical protein